MSSPLAAKTSDPRILLVEDDDGNALVSSTLLEILGCPFDVVRNGNDAVEAAARGIYSTILMDLVLPDITGVTAVEMIRSHEKKGNIQRVRIIALSAQSHIEGEHRSMNAGMDGYLCKPLQLDELREKILAT